MRYVASLIVGLFLGVFGFWAFTKCTCSAESLKVHKEKALKDIVYGDPKAPMKVTEYSSVGCYHCSDFHNTVWQDIKEQYVDKGKVFWVAKNFPLSGVDLKAILLAQCSDRTHELTNFYFENQSRWLLSDNPLEAIQKIALEFGLSESQVQNCLENEELLNILLGQRLQAQMRYNITGTPAFVVGKSVINGAVPFEAFTEILDQFNQHVKAGGVAEEFKVDTNVLKDRQLASLISQLEDASSHDTP